jgi:hypothetical protein
MAREFSLKNRVFVRVAEDHDGAPNASRRPSSKVTITRVGILVH